MEHRHVVIYTFPAQGHLNPALQFAYRLNSVGVTVTFVTSLSARAKIDKDVVAGAQGKLLRFAYYSDGFDGGFTFRDDMDKLKTEMRRESTKTLRETLAAAEEEGLPVTYVVYTLLLQWAAEVAREYHVPAALLWIQPAAVLAIYYYYFNGLEVEISSKSDDPDWKLQLPGYSYSFSQRDIPSFLLPSSPSLFQFSALQSFKEQIDFLHSESNPDILVNTFDELETEILQGLGNWKLIGVGPLVPYSIIDKKDGVFGEPKEDYIEWLSSKPNHSVVYVSFGSLLSHPKEQMEKIAKGLLTTKRPFLWIIRDDKKDEDDHKKKLTEEVQGFGKIVSWCKQLEVLTHPSLGCFMSHCGWNSTIESLACGVPMVAFPHWTDQGTNAKMIEDVWRVGVRVKAGDGGIVEDEEISRCIELVMDGGESSREMRYNAQKWKASARKAALEENGSSRKNLMEFVGHLS